MKELKSGEYFVAFLTALNKEDKDLKELLRQLYHKAFEGYKFTKEEIDKAFEDWYSGLDRIYDNVLEIVEVYGKSDEFKNILDKYIPQAKKVIDFVNRLTGGEE
jgi:hypothetical protein